MVLPVDQVALPVMSKPSVVERAIALMILLAILLLLAGLMYQLFLQPQRELSQQLEVLQFRYQKALRLESRREALELQLQQLQQAQSANDSLLLKESSKSLAAAALQERVKAVVNRNSNIQKGCQIKQQKSMSSTDDELFTQVAVNVQLTCSLEALQAVLYDLETENPVLVFNNLIIQKSQNKNRRKKSQNSPNVVVLEAQFDVGGYIEKSVESAEKPPRRKRS